MKPFIYLSQISTKFSIPSTKQSNNKQYQNTNNTTINNNINLNNNNIEFYCKPLENLIEIKIILNGKVINIKDALYGILTFRKAFNLKYYEEWYHKTNYLNPRY